MIKSRVKSLCLGELGLKLAILIKLTIPLRKI